jgi:transcriptional regulator with XRE-family HTH domain
MPFNTRLKKLRQNKGITQDQLAKETGINRSTLGMYEAGKREPNFETLELLADYFNVDMNTLLDSSHAPASLPPLNQNDERDLARDLEDMMHSMASAAYDGEGELEDVEAFKATLKAAMIQAKRIAKKKYTPKKYRAE